jgi:hypothetical protein
MNAGYTHIQCRPRPGNPECLRCHGRLWYAYDHNHKTICHDRCPHDQGWWQLTEGHGNPGWWCCRAGCGKSFPTLAEAEANAARDTHHIATR